MAAINFDVNFWTLMGLVLNFGLALFVALSNRNKAATDELKAVKSDLQKDIKEVDQRVVEQGERLSAIESDVENGISKDDLIVVHRRMDKVLETVGPLAGRLEEISKGMERVDKHLIELLRK